MTHRGLCNWAGRRWERKGRGNQWLTGWHLSPGLLPGDRTHGHLRTSITQRGRRWGSLGKWTKSPWWFQHIEMFIYKHLQRKTTLNLLQRPEVIPAALGLLRCEAFPQTLKIWQGEFNYSFHFKAQSRPRDISCEALYHAYFILSHPSFDACNQLIPFS